MTSIDAFQSGIVLYGTALYGAERAATVQHGTACDSA